MSIVNEIFSNPAATGFIGTILGSSISVLINRKTALDLRQKEENFQRLKLAVDAGIEDHRYYSDLSIRVADKTGAKTTIYPSVFSILQTKKIHDLLRKELSDTDLVASLSAIQKEMTAIQKAFAIANENNSKQVK